MELYQLYINEGRVFVVFSWISVSVMLPSMIILMVCRYLINLTWLKLALLIHIFIYQFIPSSIVINSSIRPFALSSNRAFFHSSINLHIRMSVRPFFVLTIVHPFIHLFIVCSFVYSSIYPFVLTHPFIQSFIYLPLCSIENLYAKKIRSITHPVIGSQTILDRNSYDILLVKRLFFLLLVIYIFFSRDTNQQDRFLLHKNLLTAFILRTVTYFIDYYTYLTLTDSLQVGCIMIKNILFLVKVMIYFYHFKMTQGLFNGTISN